MPQLDFVIAFPQIFWLIVIFFSFYTVVVHFFLPNFIKSLKSRKQIVLENTKILIDMEIKFKIKQSLLKKTLEKNFIKIRLLLENDLYQFFSTKDLFDLTLINIKVVRALYYNILYYDINILSSIFLKTSLLN